MLHARQQRLAEKEAWQHKQQLAAAKEERKRAARASQLEQQLKDKEAERQKERDEVSSVPWLHDADGCVLVDCMMQRSACCGHVVNQHLRPELPMHCA